MEEKFSIEDHTFLLLPSRSGISILKFEDRRFVDSIFRSLDPFNGGNNMRIRFIPDQAGGSLGIEIGPHQLPKIALSFPLDDRISSNFMEIFHKVGDDNENDELLFSGIGISLIEPMGDPSKLNKEGDNITNSTKANSVHVQINVLTEANEPSSSITVWKDNTTINLGWTDLDTISGERISTDNRFRKLEPRSF